ncbi:MAG: hypothetical protein AAF841_00430 [Pseudomonadota bacterium]
MTQSRRSLLAPVVIFALCALGACAPRLPASSNDAPGRQSAFFEAFPAPLFAAIDEGCQSDIDRLTRVSRTELVCESLPSPQAAAALILQYDGDVEALPTFVTTLYAVPLETGYEVTTEYFYLVPQKGGDVAVIRFRQPRIEQTVRRVFASAGGRSI